MERSHSAVHRIFLSDPTHPYFGEILNALTAVGGVRVQSLSMNRHSALLSLTLRGRASRLGRWLAGKKIEEARHMKPEARRLLSLELSDFCLELKRSCSDSH